ncbi:MAG TPA: polyamine ABC transporter permease, partial [Citreicella sp.]|nr:polyamine ABC transporter permease [Citreicella sp.]
MSTVILTPSAKQPLSFTLPTLAAAGALAGMFVGAANGSVPLGILGGALLLAALGFAAMTLPAALERPLRWGLVALLLLAGYAMSGVSGAILGALFGWFFGWFVYWIGWRRYRMPLVPYLTAGQVLWHYTFRVICGAIFVFLITPILVIIPLSFNAQNFFTFTPEMLDFDPAGYSLQHYVDFLTNPEWTRAVRNSLIIAPLATIISVTLGTLAAIGLSQSHVPGRRAIMAILISPMIVPLIISATGMYFFYSKINIVGTLWGVVLAHAVLGIPFVII